MLFTISIPTYNRRTLLERNLKHLEELNFDKKNFEVIVVDDGSTDDTSLFVESFLKTTKLQLRFYKKENGGKHSALKMAIEKAKGAIFINTDSDDYLVKECLNVISSKWKLYCIDENDKLAGLIGQNLNMRTQEVLGNRDFTEGFISDPIEMRFKHHLKGDKIPIIKTKIMKACNFPSVNKNVKFIPESYLLYGVSSKYQFVYIQDFLQECDYQSGGLTNGIQQLRVNNAEGVLLTYQRYVELIPVFKSVRGYFRNYINYVRFSLLSKNIFRLFSIFDVLLIPIAFVLYCKDKLLK